MIIIIFKMMLLKFILLMLVTTTNVIALNTPKESNDTIGGNWKTYVVTDTMSGEQADALTNRSKKFFRTEKAESTDEKFRQACERILLLLDKGTYTNLATEINKIRLKLDKNQLNESKAHNLIMTLAVKFAEMPAEDEDTAALISELPIEITDEPDIIISETFTA